MHQLAAVRAAIESLVGTHIHERKGNKDLLRRIKNSSATAKSRYFELVEKKSALDEDGLSELAALAVLLSIQNATHTKHNPPSYPQWLRYLIRVDSMMMLQLMDSLIRFYRNPNASVPHPSYSIIVATVIVSTQTMMPLSIDTCNRTCHYSTKVYSASGFGWTPLLCNICNRLLVLLRESLCGKLWCRRWKRKSKRSSARIAGSLQAVH